ncbi:unnamed protein product, partial [Didymodactylos carnosus]
DSYEYDIVDYKRADDGIVPFLKYFSNFLFYRFGIEICNVMTVIVIAVRLDVMAVLYAIWLGLFLMSKRRALIKIWPIYLLFLLIVFPVQYMIVVGPPPFLCFRYWWSHVSFDGWPQLKRWLYLPDYVNPPSAQQLIADFFQLLCASQQWRVFVHENNEKDSVFTDAGGSNREIIYDKDLYVDNPAWDYVMKKRHWLDQLKYIVFMYGCWTVLAIAYLAGTTRISLLGLGYLISCFYFLWYGQEFLTKPILKLIKMWNYLIYYCFAVIFVKACLQVVACVGFVSTQCWVIQIFAITCLKSGAQLFNDYSELGLLFVVVCIFLYKSIACGAIESAFFCAFIDLFVPCLKQEYIPQNNNCNTDINQPCDRSAGDASLFMDGFCLIFLLLQKRIFSSYYWEHIVTELRSQAKLASQGAVLFNMITKKRIDEDIERENETVRKIKCSLERIKAQQQKLNQTGGLPDESSEHYEAIRSGDYYMFDYESDEIVDESKKDDATAAQEQILEVLTSDNDTDLQTTSLEDNLQPNQTLTTSSIEEGEVPMPIQRKKSRGSVMKPIFKKIKSITKIIVDYWINLFNHYSQDYRQVSRKLAEMKSRDKVVRQSIIEQDKQQSRITTSEGAPVIDLDPLAGGDNNLIVQPKVQTTVQVENDDVLANRSRFYRLLDSIFYMLMSRSELLCYSFMVINHLTSGALLSMPLPLSIFLWAMLSSRPSRNYWITVLTYTEAMIVIKYIFQFRFYPWNVKGFEEQRPLAPVNIIGIDRKGDAASVADLFLLLSLFLHRSILKQMGLWKADHQLPELPTTAPVKTVQTISNSSEDIAQTEPVVKYEQRVKKRMRKYVHRL